MTGNAEECRARAPTVPHEYLTVAQLVERGTVNVYSGDP